MGVSRCIAITKEVEALAGQFPGKHIGIVKSWIEQWQEDNNKDWDTYPTVADLQPYAEKVPQQDPIVLQEEAEFEAEEMTDIEAIDKIAREMDAKTREHRAKIIARGFSNLLTTRYAEHLKSLQQREMEAEEAGDRYEAEILRRTIANLERRDTLAALTPRAIFDEMKESFEWWVNTDKAKIIRGQKKLFNRNNPNHKLSAEELDAFIEKTVNYRIQEYKKIVDNWRALGDEAARFLIRRERIRMDMNSLSPKEDDNDAENRTNTDPSGEQPKLTDPEDKPKDNWMTNFRETSSYDHLSEKVRQAIDEIPKLDYKGEPEYDDLGNPEYLDSSYVHAVLIDIMDKAVTADDMIPLFEAAVPTKPWMTNIIKAVQNDERLFSQMYSDLRLDLTDYWIQKTVKNHDGSYNIQTISLNKPAGISYLYEDWRNNFENANKLDEDSIYDRNRVLREDKAAIGKKLARDLMEGFRRLTFEEAAATLRDKSNGTFDTLYKMFKMVGMDVNPASLMESVTTKPKGPEGAIWAPTINPILNGLFTIFDGVLRGEVKSKKLANGTIIRGDLLDAFRGAFRNIAEKIAEVGIDGSEDMVYQNGKARYTHTTPSYLGKLVKQLRNVTGDEVKFNKFIDEEFRQYDFFYNQETGEWRNDWIRQIVEDPAVRKKFAHKVVLDKDKKEYAEWSDLDTTMVLLGEYYGPMEEKNGVGWANYHLPILSDTESSEFLKFKKYINHKFFLTGNEEGDSRDFETILAEKFTDVILQEMNRINTVISRDKILRRSLGFEYNDETAEEKAMEDPGIKAIPNYDIKRDPDTGHITSIGGAEFKFLPALNTWKNPNGTSFLEEINRLQQEGATGEQLRNYIEEIIKETINDSFEDTFEKWQKIGLLDTTEKGTYIHLKMAGLYDNKSVKKARAEITKAMQEAKYFLGEQWTSAMENLLQEQILDPESPVSRSAEAARIRKQIKSLLGQTTELTENGVAEIAANREAFNHAWNNIEFLDVAKEKLREYYWNSKFATSQIIQLTTTDLAYYPDQEVFQKRFKELHAPSKRLNTSSKYGRKMERTVYIKDSIVMSDILSDIEQILNTRMATGAINQRGKDYIMNLFKEVNAADRQAYRSLSSYRAIMDMSGQWDDKMQIAFERIQEGKWDMNDFTVIWQAKKPYVYTQTPVRSGIGNGKIKMAVQHKNSEFLLLAMHALTAGTLGKDSKLAGINEFMEENNIDVIQFDSCVKVGAQGAIDLSQATDKASAKAALKEQVTFKGQENPDVIHEISYEDYGIQSATPNHSVDAIQLIGVQFRKGAVMDISPDAEFDIPGFGKMTKDQLLDFYNKVNTENILQSFASINKDFKNPKTVERILQDELRGSHRYSLDLLKALTLDNSGKFNMPLFDNVQSQIVEQVLNSVFKKNITRQKIKGGSLIQATSYGISDKLNIVFEGEGENKRVKYYECLMPAWTREFFEPLMKEGSHELDISKLPDDLRKAIAYRIPTEGKHSMIPLYVKGFLPQQSGGSIMLPLEITTITDADFDVDKLYIMLYEMITKHGYDKQQYIEDETRKYFAKYNLLDKVDEEDLIRHYAQLRKTIDEGRVAPEGTPEHEEWLKYKAARGKYTRPDRTSFEKIKYDFSKEPHQNSRQQRNNLMIDLIWGVLTNKDTTDRLVLPVGFDQQKRAAKINIVLENAGEEDLKDALDLDSKATREDILKALTDLSTKELIEMAGDFTPDTDPLDPSTFTMFHQRNMAGAKLITIYAVHNGNNAVMQNTKLALSPDYGMVQLNGKRLTSLHDIKNREGQYISQNTSGFFGAAVDNGKDAVLGDMAQNLFTAPASMSLIRAGYTVDEVGLLMAQPIVKDITVAHFRRQGEYRSFDTIFDDVIRQYKLKAGVTTDITYEDVQDRAFPVAELAYNMLRAKRIESLSNTNQAEKIRYYKEQLAVAYLFKRVMSNGEALGGLVSNSRVDGQNGAAGPTIAATINKQRQLDRYRVDTEAKRYPLVNVPVLEKLPTDLPIAELREQLLKSPTPWLQAFQTCGIDATEDMLKSYFPFFREDFQKILWGDDTNNGIADYTRNGKLDNATIKQAFNEAIVYSMTKIPFFGEEIIGNTPVSMHEKRRAFINKFPAKFKQIIAANPDIAELEFIKRLQVKSSWYGQAPVDILTFRNVGKLTPSLKDRYTNEWQQLLYMGPEAQKLALNLLRYSFYRNGLGFGPNSFVHLAPVFLRMITPGYKNNLQNILDSQDDYSKFIPQFIINHRNNYKFCPVLRKDSTIEWVNDDGTPRDTVVLNADNPGITSEDKKLINKRMYYKGDIVGYTYRQLMAREINGNMEYYWLDEASVLRDPFQAEYTRIPAEKLLGSPNYFLEYEYGKDISEIETAINPQDNSVAEVTVTEESRYNKETGEFDTYYITSEPDEISAVQDDADSDIINSVEEIEDPYATLWGEEDGGIKEDSINNYPPNEDFKDAEDQEICGGKPNRKPDLIL
jgi:hypothetical protein